MSVLHHLFSWRLDNSTEEERDHLHEKQMDAEGDSPQDRGTARNVGDMTCPGQGKSGQKLIRAYASIATPVTLSHVKCRVLWSRQPDFCKLIKLCFKASCDYWPAVIIALLASLYLFIFFYYGQWRSFDFWEINRKLKAGSNSVLLIKMMQIRLFPAFI